MERYDILEWQKFYEDGKNVVDEKKDFLESRSIVLYPGRFYVLNYRSSTKKRYNARPVILSLGINKNNPDDFICLDLTVMPKKLRLQFVDMYFKLFYNDIMKIMDEHPYVEDADKQDYIKLCSYENLCKALPQFPVKLALKKYVIKNTKKIYSLPFIGVYKVIGDYCDQNFYQNGTISDAQKEFIEKMRTIRK